MEMHFKRGVACSEGLKAGCPEDQLQAAAGMVAAACSLGQQNSSQAEEATGRTFAATAVPPR